MPRQSICFPRWGTQDVTKNGDQDFEEELLRWYSPEEAQALEGLVDLKAKLRQVPDDDFWTATVEGISHIMGAEIAFVMKRLLVDDQSRAVEMPPIGEPGSCLMAAALHYCTSDGNKHTIRENSFHAYACPCAYMRHDRIFVIPQDLDSFITNNPNNLPIPVDSYMAVPLFAEGKCIAHFGVMWLKESSPNKRLSWPFVEMMLHALEDLIGQRLLEGSSFVKVVKAAPPSPSSVDEQQSRVIPHHAISVAQSLRPYAGSLSHELRTPMQGVVGMLDVMYATVQEAVQSSEDEHLKKVFQNLIESIEVVQDSSRRAVVAADNVVHAYDMNMSVPESNNMLSNNGGSISPRTPASAILQNDYLQPEIVVAGQDLPLASRSSTKRGRSEDTDVALDSPKSKVSKINQAMTSWAQESEASEEIKEGLYEAENVHAEDKDVKQISHQNAVPRVEHPDTVSSPSIKPPHGVHRSANVRAVLQYVINEGLKTGGRPDWMSATSTDTGEIIEVRSRGSNNTVRQKMIQWTVDEDMPTTLNYDEKDFSKLISCLVLNAIKFTDGMDGRIKVHARMSGNGRSTTITISDNGPGMPKEFLPRLFQPFSQSNGSITRQSDGLGLGLMVAKGIARKLGGDLICLKSETQSPNNGCKFEIKLPLAAGDIISRPSSPLHSPISQRRHDDPFSHMRDQSSRSRTPPTSNGLGLANGTRAPVIGFPDRASTPPAATEHRQQLKRSLSAINMVDAEKAAAKSTPRTGKTKSSLSFEIDRSLSAKYPLSFLVAEDNKINRKLLVSMLGKFGYAAVLEAHDGADAVRQMSWQAANGGKIDVVLMDLWMPLMDGYEAAERILAMDWQGDADHPDHPPRGPTVLAVTADVTNGALDRAAQAGMKGFMTKPYKLQDLQRLITEYCTQREAEAETDVAAVKTDFAVPPPSGEGGVMTPPPSLSD